MNWEAVIARLLPGVLQLAWQCLSAIAAGDAALAARRAEEAARRQAVRLGVDAVLKSRKP